MVPEQFEHNLCGAGTVSLSGGCKDGVSATAAKTLGNPHAGSIGHRLWFSLHDVAVGKLHVDRQQGIDLGGCDGPRGRLLGRPGLLAVSLGLG